MAEIHFISKSFCSEMLGQNRKYTSTKQHHNRTNQNRPVLFALNFADINTLNRWVFANISDFNCT